MTDLLGHEPPKSRKSARTPKGGWQDLAGRKRAGTLGEAGFERVERPEALRRGLPTYFTGRPCRRGHIAPRTTANSTCSKCANNAKAKRRDANPELARAKHRAHYRLNPNFHNAGKLRYPKEREARIRAAAEWQRKNPDRVNAKNRRWRRANPGTVNARTARQRAARKQATPAWLTDAQLSEIRQFYRDGAAAGLHVDHIVPLNGCNVCGLHVPWNLQLLRPRDNCSKSNKVLP